MSDALHSQGMYIEVATSPGVYVTIPEVKTIGGPTGTVALLDATHLLSTGKEYKTGLPDYGDVPITFNYIPDNAVQEYVRNLWATSATGYFKLHFTDNSNTVWAFEGYVSGFSQTAGVDTLLQGNATIKLSGAITVE